MKSIDSTDTNISQANDILSQNGRVQEESRKDKSHIYNSNKPYTGNIFIHNIDQYSLLIAKILLESFLLTTLSLYQ